MCKTGFRIFQKGPRILQDYLEYEYKIYSSDTIHLK